MEQVENTVVSSDELVDTFDAEKAIVDSVDINLLQEKVSALLQISIDYKKKSIEAKTKTKRDYYTKKLHRHNQILYKAVNFLEYFKQQKQAHSVPVIEPTNDAIEV